MSLQGCLFLESRMSLNCASDSKYWQTVMRISFETVNGIQVLPAVTPGAVLIPHKNLLITTCKRKTGQGTIQDQRNNTLLVAFVCVLKIETQ